MGDIRGLPIRKLAERRQQLYPERDRIRPAVEKRAAQVQADKIHPPKAVIALNHQRRKAGSRQGARLADRGHGRADKRAGRCE